MSPILALSFVFLHMQNAMTPMIMIRTRPPAESPIIKPRSVPESSSSSVVTVLRDEEEELEIESDVVV